MNTTDKTINKKFDRILSGIIDVETVTIEAEEARHNTVTKAIEGCDGSEYILTIAEISERIDPVALYNFIWLYLENRRFNFDYNSLFVKVKIIGGDTGFVELHSTITGECLYWKYCEEISQTESIRP